MTRLPKSNPSSNPRAETLPRPAGNSRVVSVDVRYFDAAMLVAPPIRIIDDGTDSIAAIYVDGRLDRIEWEHVREDGLLERHVAPVSNVARLWTIR